MIDRRVRFVVIAVVAGVGACSGGGAGGLPADGGGDAVTLPEDSAIEALPARDGPLLVDVVEAVPGRDGSLPVDVGTDGAGADTALGSFVLTIEVHVSVLAVLKRWRVDESGRIGWREENFRTQQTSQAAGTLDAGQRARLIELVSSPQLRERLGPQSPCQGITSGDTDVKFDLSAAGTTLARTVTSCALPSNEQERQAGQPIADLFDLVTKAHLDPVAATDAGARD
jgi:hypothetical protein